MSVLLIKPHQNPTYEKAVSVFCDLYRKVTGKFLPVSETDDGVSPLVIIGSDAVNDVLMRAVLEGEVGSLGIRYGTDDYTLCFHTLGGRPVLILAGGRLRSTLFAIYDYFERFLGCHWFWDGDVIPHHDGEIPMEGETVVEKPRFEYRGLRYFAHRGLKRFQAEHWSLEDWKKELDWMLKKRLNFFMLRIGMDDLWQRAFPDFVPYPEAYRNITGIDAEGYNDRSDFWTMEFRGKLREAVLSYARELDLEYPVDCGTMTHWYSRTPVEFLEKKHPEVIDQDFVKYSNSDTGKVFDFTKKQNMDYYMHLTETSVREYDKHDHLFHTIGLGERRIYKDKQKNFNLKLIAYRRIAESLRQRFPASKLMLASWDFIGWWEPNEVQALLDEMDPNNTLVLDYTSEVNDPEISFLKWGVVGKFPWIFGLFHAFESESELRGPYDRSDERLKVAADDPYCKGMIFWPELSHSDPLVLEYLSENSWSPLKNKVEEIASEFCRKRYGKRADFMNEIWQGMLPFIKEGDWGGYSRRQPGDEGYVENCRNVYTHKDMWSKLLLFYLSKQNSGVLLDHYDWRIPKELSHFDSVITSLEKLTTDPEAFSDPFLRRDAVDLVRTPLSRFLNFAVIRSVQAQGDAERVEALRERYMDLLHALIGVLSVVSDYSLCESLEELKRTSPVNPDFELTLKRNTANVYCAQAILELIPAVYIPEAEVFFDHLASSEKGEVGDLESQRLENLEKFYQTPLTDYLPASRPSPVEAIENAITALKAIYPYLK